MGKSTRGHSDMNLGESGDIWSSDIAGGCPFLPYIIFVSAELLKFRISEN